MVGKSSGKNMEIEKGDADSPDTELYGSAVLVPKKYNLRWLIIITVLVSAIAGSVFGFMAGGIPSLTQEFSGFFSQVINGNLPNHPVVQEDLAVINVVKKATPAVVSIIVSKSVNGAGVKKNFPSPSDGQGNEQNQGSSNTNNVQGGMSQERIAGGSGFFVTSSGVIVTNKHVVSDPTATYTVVTNDGKEHLAKILATDPANDIAVIKIAGNNFPILNIGNSDSLEIGQTVIAIGNSLGQFSNTVSKGIISGLGRNLTASGGFGESEQLNDIIQTDAAINLGNSGGPLLDINGNVIGVNVAMAQGAQDIGFALPADQVKKVVDRVEVMGKAAKRKLWI